MTNHGVDEGMGSKMTQLLPSEEEVMLRREGGGERERGGEKEGEGHDRENWSVFNPLKPGLLQGD